jgi:hypothetical protein
LCSSVLQHGDPRYTSVHAIKTKLTVATHQLKLEVPSRYVRSVVTGSMKADRNGKIFEEVEGDR